MKMEKNKIQVVNIKCGGCANHITSELEKIDCKNITIDIEKQEITFVGDKKMATEKLSKLGYPEASSDEAKSILKKAKSYMSCAIGKQNKTNKKNKNKGEK